MALARREQASRLLAILWCPRQESFALQRLTVHLGGIVSPNDEFPSRLEKELFILDVVNAMPAFWKPCFLINLCAESRVLSERCLCIVIHKEQVSPGVQSAIPARRKNGEIFVILSPEV